MISFLKKMFNSTEENETVNVEQIKILNLNDIKKHFESIAAGNDVGYKPNLDIIDEIKSKIIPNKKILFILDDEPNVVDIIVEDITYILEKYSIVDKFQIIPMVGKEVGFDFLAVLNEDIHIDCLITDITFAGNNKINGENFIIDGIDVVILTKMKFNDIEYILFTGNALTENNHRTFNFVKKFQEYMIDNIFDKVIIKSKNIDFENEKLIMDLLEG